MGDAYRNPLPVYCLGWLCFWIVMLWPLRWFDRLPRHICGLAGIYAHDGRQYND